MSAKRRGAIVAGTAVLAALTTTTTYTRDLRDAILTRVVTTGATTFRHWYDYDDRGLLGAAYASTGTTKPATADVAYTYRPSGQVATRQFAGGPVVAFGYTIREQLAAIGDVTTTTSPFSARYAYNPNGTVAEAEFYNAGIASAPRYRYTFGPAGYDALNRLLSADFSSWNGSGWTGTLAYDLAGMQYDRAGNLTALQRYGPAGTLLDNLTYAYTAGTNRLATVTDLVGGTGETWDAESGGFTYDATGNMVTGPAPYGMTAVTYDHRNLPLILTANGVTSAYRYDEQGQRISKQVGGGNTEYYVLDGRTSLAVVTVDGVGSAVTWTWNLLAGDKVVGRETQTAERFYYHTDLLGSTRVVVQGATVVEAYDYDPWGVRLDGRVLAGPTKEGFTTKERDAESGLDYFGARYYMAALGRWTSVDPLVDSFPAWNGYNYVKNNPAFDIDPDGLEIRFEGDEKNQARLREALHLAKAVLRIAAKNGDKLAKNVLKGIEAMEKDKRRVTVVKAGPVDGALGETSVDGTTVTIDLAKGDRNNASNPGDNVPAVTLVHELGHSFAVLGYDLFLTRKSSVNAVQWGNAVRASIGSSCRQPESHFPTFAFPINSGSCHPGR